MLLNRWLTGSHTWQWNKVLWTCRVMWSARAPTPAHGGANCTPSATPRPSQTSQTPSSSHPPLEPCTCTQHNTHSGWLYLGSHALSSASWGSLSTSNNPNGPSSPSSLNCRNWELGVVLKVTDFSHIPIPLDLKQLRPYRPGEQPFLQT